MSDRNPAVRSRSEWLVFSGKDDDFPVWGDRFEAYMQMKKLYPTLIGKVILTEPAALLGDIDAPVQAAYDKAKAEYDAAVVKLDEDKLLIWCELVQFLDKESLVMLRHECKNDGPKAWLELKNRFKSAEKPRIMTLMTRLTSLKLGSDETMEAYLNRAREIAYNLQEVNEPVSDTMLSSLVLRGLPDKYSSFVTVQNFSTADFAETRRKLQTFADNLESQRQFDNPHQSSAPTFAMYGHGGPSNRGRGNWQGRGQARGSGRGYSGNRGGGRGQGFKGKCHNCGQVGHMKAQCTEPPRSAPVSVHVTTEETCLSASSECLKFVVDSGCTDHMFNRREYFIEYTPTEGAASTRNANGSLSTIAGRGRAMLSVKNEYGERRKLIFESALHVPDYAHNLISVTAATDNGHKFVFGHTEGCMQLTNGEKIPLIKDKRLYLLECHTDTPSSHQSTGPQSTTDADSTIWHRRMGHLNHRDVLKSTGKGTPNPNVSCQICPLAKIAKTPVPASVDVRARSTIPLERIHSDVCGPLQTPSVGGSRFVVSFIDDFSRFAVLYFIKAKSEVLSCFRQFTAEYSHTGKVRIIRSDNGGEYTSHAFATYCTEQSIKHEFTVPDTPQQNGVAERYFRTAMEMTRSLLLDSGLPHKFWVRAMDTACFVRNRCVSSSLEGNKTPYELLYGRPPTYSKMRIFGCSAFSMSRDPSRRKLDPKADKGIFVGYDSCSPAYLIYFPGNDSVQRARNVIFDETEMGKLGEITPTTETAGDRQFEALGLPLEGEERPIKPAQIHPVEPQALLEPDALPQELDALPQEPEVPAERPPQIHERPRRETRVPRRFDAYVMYNDDQPEEEPFCGFVAADGAPATIQEALRGPDADHWTKAAESEYDALCRNDTWDLEPLPKDRKSIGGKWVLRVKTRADGTIDKYKARFVAKGYNQIEGIDYHETFAPTAKPETVRMLLAIAAQDGGTLWLMDVKSAYLQSDVKEEIYVQQPSGFEQFGPNGQKLYCKLKKSLYGLKQAGHNWNSALNDWIVGEGFTRSQHDYCLYVKCASDSYLFIVIWVDDIIICGLRGDDVVKLRKRLSESFEMDDRGELSWFLGMSVTMSAGTVTVNQTAYAKSILEKFQMSECKAVATPLAEKEELIKSQCPEEGSDEQIRMSQNDYRGLIGGVLYLATHTRPDLSFAVGALSKFLSNPGEIHWTAAKRLLRYIKGTIHYGLTYQKSDSLKLFGYCDADWAGDNDDRRSTTGYCFFLNENSAAISWASRKQPTVSLSTAEAEYMAVGAAAQEVKFLNGILHDLTGKIDPVVIFEDNQACMAMAKNPQFHRRSKHIDIRHHFIREMIQDSIIELQYCQTERMVADILTKGLNRIKTDRFRGAILNFICESHGK